MRRLIIDFNCIPDVAREEFEGLVKRATRAREAAIRSWESDPSASPKWRTGIWAELKKWMLTHLTKGHCAYCERHLATCGQPGAADHFRPKKRVDHLSIPPSDDSRVKTSLPNQSIIYHPGYFWIAYDWENILPACNACNSGAKGTYFPVAHRHCLLEPISSGGQESSTYPGYYYPTIAELDQLEEPMLVNPVMQDPGEHLVFGQHGAISSNSDRGQLTIIAFGLEKDGAVRSRSHYQQIALTSAIFHFGSAVAGGADLKGAALSAAKATETLRDGTNPHSAAANAVLEGYLKKF
jgi:hypothetical protein